MIFHIIFAGIEGVMSCVGGFCKQANRICGDWVDPLTSVGKDLEFKNKSITYERYCESSYSEENWGQRKIRALFIAAGGVGRAALRLLAGIPIAYFHGWHVFRYQVFYVVRDLQQAWGGLALLFNDRYGSFHLYESECEKREYDQYFLDCAKERAELQQFGALKISEMSPEAIKELFESYPWKEYPRLFGMIPKDEVHRALYKGTVYRGFLSHVISPPLLEGLRISELPDKTLDDIFGGYANPLGSSSFACFEASEVHKALQAGRIELSTMARCDGLLSEEQLRDLDMTKWSEGELNRLRLEFNLVKNRSDFWSLKPDFVCKYLYAHAKVLSELPYKEVRFLRFLSYEQLRSLQISQLTTKMLSRIFQVSGILEKISPPSSKDDVENFCRYSRAQFANIQIAEVQAALEKGLLNKVLIALISLEQLKGIDKTKLTDETSAMLDQNNYDALMASIEEGERPKDL